MFDFGLVYAKFLDDGAFKVWELRFDDGFCCGFHPIIGIGMEHYDHDWRPPASEPAKGE